jgi:hypothetical protein
MTECWMRHAWILGSTEVLYVRLRRSIVRLLIALVWRAYMRRALALTVREVENAASASTAA